MDRKRRQVERYLEQTKHQRSPDEAKRIAREARARKAGRKQRSARGGHDWIAESDELFDTERIPRSPGKGRSTAGTAPGAEAREPGSLRPEHAGLVLELAPGRACLWHAGRRVEATLSEHLARTQQTSLAVGDLVELDARHECDGQPARVVAVLPRRSTLSRPDPSLPGRERVIAANVDRAVIVIATREPAFRQGLIDRYLVALERGCVEPVLCASKADLLEGDAPEHGRIAAILDGYRKLGIRAFFTDLSGAGVPELRQAITGRTVVFVGQSGVGKSSLLNALAPDLDLRTSTVRAGDGKGRHTTTSSSLYELDGGTRVIDTPGVRSFGLYGIRRSELGSYFPEFADAGACRFNDCSHRTEPACGVRRAVEAGEVAAARYEAYLRMWESLEPG